MERMKGLCLTGAVFAMGLANMPANAQNDASKASAIQTNQNKINSMRSDMSWDKTLPVSSGQNQMLLLRTLKDSGFGKAEIIKVLPLFEDLRDAEIMYKFSVDDAADNWAMMRHRDSDNGSDRVRTSAQTFRDKRESIWNAIGAAVGTDKAMALRPLVEPVKQDISTASYTDSHLERIDQLIKEWDRQSAERTASLPNTGNNTASTVSVETTTVTTTTMIPGIEVYSFPPLTTQDVVDVLEMRLAAMEGMGAPDAVLAIRGHELTSPNLRWLREKNLKYWD
jgi:hypothetical protein